MERSEDLIGKFKEYLWAKMEKETIWREGEVLSLSQKLDELLNKHYINDRSFRCYPSHNSHTDTI